MHLVRPLTNHNFQTTHKCRTQNEKTLGKIGSEKDERAARERQCCTISNITARKRRVLQRLLLLHRQGRQCRTPPAPRRRHFRLRRGAAAASTQGHGAGHVDEQRRVVSRTGGLRSEYVWMRISFFETCIPLRCCSFWYFRVSFC